MPPVFTGMLGRLAIVTSVLIGHLVASFCGEVDFSKVSAASCWVAGVAAIVIYQGMRPLGRSGTAALD
ncbi:hypothetical protein TPAU25S_03057 [Tsukamurella paurometabola]|uniref:hypothetical protein n=1 Tax=Tsukamurella paurometabola TaxID=2061 RepID=UPI000301C83E|nr:hypothetical protein [Tsukamurella paurometabola]SUP30391.1 Uncharacterised protein [Tsukamurella paurometabola]